MSAPREESRQGAVAQRSGTDESLGLPLTCPECGVSGWVDWKSLKNGIGCPQCGCQFLIGRNGQVISQAELRHLRFTCPRCKHSGAIPSSLCARGTRCPECKLPLALGPDQRLHDVDEAAELWRAKGAGESQRTLADRLADKFLANDGRIRKWAIAACSTLLAGLLVCAFLVLQSIFDSSPERVARTFAQTCLAGEWNSALGYLEDNAVQRAHFQRWRSRYFTSILDTYRPSGDKVSIGVSALTVAPQSRVLHVTMKSPFIGSRSYIQHWRLHNGQWLFDVRETLVEHDGLPQTSRRKPSRRPAAM